jgi:hypothetical protein
VQYSSLVAKNNNKGVRKMQFHKRRLYVVVGLLAAFVGGAMAHGDEDHSQDDKKSSAIPAVSATGTASNSGILQRLADGSLFVPKPVQRQLQIRTERVRIGALSATVELNGKVIADPAASGRVQAIFAGSVVPGPKGMPLPGAKVNKGDVLAYLRPISGAIERANQQSQLAELDASTAIAERNLVRLEQLVGAVPQKEIDAVRIERDALRRRKGFVSASINVSEPLRAPVSGVISSTSVVAGQVVDAKEILFDIVNPDRLVVEALSYDTGLGATLVSANAVAEQFTLPLKFIGAGLHLREQALPMLFRITRPNALVLVDQPVKVIVITKQELRGAAVPRTALTKVGAGETAVWVHTEAERFMARRIREQPLDGVNVAVVDGLHDGDRVVVNGAGLLSQVR